MAEQSTLPRKDGKKVDRPQICDFILQEKLGCGSYAVVYKAFWKTTKEVVAIKKIQKARLNQAAINNILLEIEILKNLRHEFIVEMKDFTWDDESIYLILEYCSGGDLSNFIKTRRRLPESLCRRLMQQLGKALQFLRSRHIAHMDLKPKNVLLSSSKDYSIKLADFGFAQYLKPSEKASDLRGSPLYMAPEFFLNKDYDARVDLWSIGVMFYECLFGRAPYVSKTVEELVIKITDPSPVVLPTDIAISPSCRDLLGRLLQKSPAKRITFEHFFAHEFLDFEHFPCEENNAKMVHLCKVAVEADKAQNFEEALEAYLAALEYLVPALNYEKNESRKEQLRNRVQTYMGRAEQLRDLRKRISQTAKAANSVLNPAPAVSETNSQDQIEFIDDTPVDHLKRLFENDPIAAAALESGATAEHMEQMGHFKVASEFYEVALERLMKVSRGLTAGERRTKLQRQISDWLEKAEAVQRKRDLLYGSASPPINGSSSDNGEPVSPGPPSPNAISSSPTTNNMEASIFGSCRTQ